MAGNERRLLLFSTGPKAKADRRGRKGESKPFGHIRYRDGRVPANVPELLCRVGICINKHRGGRKMGRFFRSFLEDLLPVLLGNSIFGIIKFVKLDTNIFPK